MPSDMHGRDLEDSDKLDKAVLEYIKKNNGTVDSVDVVSHFGLRCDITLFAINRLKEAGKVDEREAVWSIQSKRLFVIEV